MIDAGSPFVLLSDGREHDAPARLFERPVAIIRADAIADVAAALEQVADNSARGMHLAGFLSYEAGFAFEHRLTPLAARTEPGLPLVWFGAFERVETIAPQDVASRLPQAAGAVATAPDPATARAAYEEAVQDVQTLIAAGEIYQANLTFQCRVHFAGHPLSLYANLADRAEARWGGVLFTGEHWLLSASPELFFTLEAGRLTSRPMKGTAKRGSGRADDEAAAAALAADPKNRAENLMIVDLIRNDLSRVATPGSVRVPRLFDVETYPTLHTLTSTVEATIAPGLGAVDVLRAMFPCGSITGAPKIRAMQAIAELETVSRGAYTGSMGWIAPDGDAAFNVAIRTLTLRHGAQEARLGLGAGIVADSSPADEWAECLTKGAFVTAGQRRFDLLETMRFDPVEGIADIDRHIARLQCSAAALGFAFDRHDARNALQAATFRLREAHCIRLRVSRSGATAIEVRALPTAAHEPVRVAMSPLPVASEDFRLRHKTSDRAFYDEARASSAAFEVLFVDGGGFVTEGSFTNVFVERDGGLLTPPLTRGLLAGVLRERLIAEGRAVECDLKVADLRSGFWIGNAVRGLIAARLSD